jgi:glutaminyl-tRNA synthetase
MNDNASELTSFIHDEIEKDLKEEKYDNVHTRFPPEPNGYMHIGHAKAIFINYNTAKKYNGKFNLRFDDTNPTREETKYVEAIKDDIKWLGADWEERLCYASSYFDKIYEFAEYLIKKEKAYVCDLSATDIREYRGTLTDEGRNSPNRDRSVEENLELFEKMKNGEFEDGAKVLRAKIDMSSPNLNLRDPVLYRIMRANHHRTEDKWCIYPMYDFTHPISDYLEGITHSLCSLEFEDHRPLYEWVLRELDLKEKTPRQIEFSRLNLNYAVMSKRKLLDLVNKKVVTGWDDPRLLTISGMRRRGYTKESIIDFLTRIGVSKVFSVVDIGLLEHCLRDDLNKRAKRFMAVINPVKLVIDNYEVDKEEVFEAVNNPNDESEGTRKVKFSKELYIEKSDFMENPPKKYFRMFIGNEVRLKHAYIVKCKSVEKDEKTGKIKEIHCDYYSDTRGGTAPNGKKIKGTIQWVSKNHSVDAEIRLYNNLFKTEFPDRDIDVLGYEEVINENSLEIFKKSKIEKSILDANDEERFQFIRNGYFYKDSKDSSKDNLVFNRIVSLKDTWKKIKNKK